MVAMLYWMIGLSVNEANLFSIDKNKYKKTEKQAFCYSVFWYLSNPNPNS